MTRPATFTIDPSPVLPTVTADRLPASARYDFTYVDWDAVSDGRENGPDFVLYQGEWVDTDDVMPAPDWLKAEGYDGFNPDTMWSGLAFRYFDETGDALEGVVIGRVTVWS